MRIKTILSLFTFMLVMFVPFAHAGRAVPLINHENIPISTGSGKPVTAQQVKAAIVSAGIKPGWTFSDTGENSMTATLDVRRKHTVIVTIKYSATKISILYKDSINMNYGSDGEQVLIHPNYNRWVNNLLVDTKHELIRH